MLLINKGITEGEVVTLKIISGAEIIAKLEKETDTHYKLSKPMVLNITPQGMALMPYILSVDPDIKLEMSKSNVCMIAPTEKQFSDSYIQNTTGITLALPHVHRDAYALVAVVLDILHFAHARGDRKPIAFRNLEFGITGAKFARMLEPVRSNRFKHVGRKRKPGS